MKQLRKSLRRIFKNKKAVSQVLAAVMMIFMFVTAIGVVWGWLYPTYRRFQSTNAIHTVTSYMLRVDETVYDLYGEGVGTTKIVRMDPKYGTFFYDTGKNASLRFADDGGLYNQSYIFNDLGSFAYTMENRRGVIINEGEHDYLKGPSIQNIFFVNGSYDSLNYQGLTNLTLSRPTEKGMRMELDYRVKIYNWYDQTNDVLSISIHILQLDIKGADFSFYSYQSLKVNYNDTRIVYSDTTNVATDFYLDGSIAPLGFAPYERALHFVKPGAVANYDVNIEIVVSQFLIYY
ncbi:MAG: hypothetical protein ACTSQB_03165 [Candidatus Heimdallarchaeota archaeon]